MDIRSPTRDRTCALHALEVWHLSHVGSRCCLSERKHHLLSRDVSSLPCFLFLRYIVYISLIDLLSHPQKNFFLPRDFSFLFFCAASPV